MKKIIALLALMVVLVNLWACGKEPEMPTIPNENDSMSVQGEVEGFETEEPTKETESGEITWENWGVTDRCPARANDSTEHYYINFPFSTGFTAGSGVVSEQLDGTMSIISGQSQRSPEINELSGLFPAYFEHLEFTLDGIYGRHATDYEFFLDGDQTTTINNYDMHTFNGRISLVHDDVPREYQFVAYATTLRSNGAYAYWVVYDTSDDQSNGDLIAEYANNMAHTFREE